MRVERLESCSWRLRWACWASRLLLRLRVASLAPDRWAQQWRTAYEWSFHKWYFDEAYGRSIVRPTFTAAAELWERIDVAVIDGAVNGIARAIAWGAWFLRLMQSGQTQHYALGMALGAVVILTLLMVI